MKRLPLFLGAATLLVGCYVSSGPYEPATAGAPPPEPVYSPPPPYEPPPQPVYVQPQPRPVYSYYGQHLVPDSLGGGWCYVEGPHQHDYAPENPDWYEQDGGHWHYRGPIQFTFYAGHPLPGGGWCMIPGPHVHDYFPPHGNEWRYRRGYGYVYEGPYRADRPPPPAYWARPAPLPPRAVRRNIDRPLPPRVEPRPEPREHERFERERMERERQERDRAGRERMERERQDHERQRVDRERMDRERQDRERQDRERMDRERVGRERQDREKQDRERMDRERARPAVEPRQNVKERDDRRDHAAQPPPARPDAARPAPAPRPVERARESDADKKKREKDKEKDKEREDARRR